MDDLIGRQAAIEAIWHSIGNDNGELQSYAEAVCGDAEDAIKALPAAQPEIIRCKDCKYWKNQEASTRWLPCLDMRTDGSWYCGCAERRDK